MPASKSSDPTRAELAFLARLCRPHRAALLSATLLLLLDGAATLSLPWFAARAVDALLAGNVPGNLLLAWLAVLALQALLSWGNGVLLGRTNAAINADLGNQLYDHLQALPLRWHQDRRRGEVLALLAHDVFRLAGFVTATLAPLAPLLLTCLGALVLLARVEPTLGLLVAIGVPLFVLALRLATRSLAPLADEGLREDAARHGIAEQNLALLPVIKAFVRQDEESRRFARQSARVFELEVRQRRIEAMLAPAVRLAGSAAVLAIFWLGAAAVGTGRLQPAELVALLLYGMLLVQPASQLAGSYGRIQTARGAARRLMEVMDSTPEADHGRRSLASARGDIRFEGVAFAHPGRPALYQHLDLHVRAGETVAITGANGAGKSTLAHLLLRFVEPDAGRILLDDMPVSELRLADLRRHVGLVGQQVLLFNASLLHNIGYGRPGATREQVEAAARAAHAHDFISRLPEGYDTVVGDEGVRLSGGQKQRIALARALIRDPAVLVLDEATAMFDPEGERDFIAECHQLLRERTVLLITHRPASLALADRVLRLEDGVLAEVRRGTGPGSTSPG